MTPVSSPVARSTSRWRRCSRCGGTVPAQSDGPLPVAFNPPTAAQLAAARRSVGYDKLELRNAPRAAFRKRAAGMRLTVDGIAPGYAVDRITEELLAAGHTDFIVEIGGEVRAHGQRPEGGPWRIAVEAPLATDRKPLVGIRLRDAAVSTSGDYRDTRIDTAGRSYSHTIDPRTGSTVEGVLTSVTVIHPTAIRADAYATALMVMGSEAGLRLGNATARAGAVRGAHGPAGRVAFGGVARIPGMAGVGCRPDSL